MNSDAYFLDYTLQMLHTSLLPRRNPLRLCSNLEAIKSNLNRNAIISADSVSLSSTTNYGTKYG